MKATKPDGSRWFARGVLDLWDSWWTHPYSAGVLRDLFAQWSEPAIVLSRPQAQVLRAIWLPATGARGSKLSVTAQPPAYWDRLRTHARWREEVFCKGCSEWNAFTVDREPMSSGLLPSAVTFSVRCQFCGATTAIAFSWLAWQVISVRFVPAPQLSSRGGSA